MKHGSNGRRGRSRGNGKRHPSSNHRNFESNGPDVKVRGTAQQVLEKYLALARDAASVGDRIASENYMQHAEHYYRIINADHGSRPPNVQGRFPGASPMPAPVDPQAAGTAEEAAGDEPSGPRAPGDSGPATP